MKFQDSSFNCLKVTRGTKSVTHTRTNGRSKSNMPHQLFQSWGHKEDQTVCLTLFYMIQCFIVKKITRVTGLYNLHWILLLV